MQFVVIGYDGKDEGAWERRLAVREDHLQLAQTMYKEGALLFGFALKDEEDKMIGSMVVVEFPSRKELEKWMEIEPYITGNVWQNIEIKPCQVPGFFFDM